MNDEVYRPEEPSVSKSQLDTRLQAEFVGHGSKHVDCAPGHVQEAIARFKRGEHMNIGEQISGN